MKNEVIKVLNLEHGQEVKKYWINRGINLEGLAFTNTEEKGSSHPYYGIIGGKFSVYGLAEIRKGDAALIELPKHKKVLVRMNKGCEWKERYLIHDLGEKAVSRYLCVQALFKDEYLMGIRYHWKAWTEMKEIESKKISLEEAEKIIKKQTGETVEIIIKDKINEKI